MVWILRILLVFALIYAFYRVINRKLAKRARNQFSQLERDTGTFIKIKSTQIKYIIFASIISILAILNGNSLIKSGVVGLFAYLLLISYRIVKKNAEKKQVLQDLLNVVECLRVQLSSGISLGAALKNVPELCRNKEFSNKLTDLYLEYELSKFTVGNSARELQERFNYSETRIFISSLNQQSQNTSAFEAFDNLIELLKEKYIDYMEENTKTKAVIMVFGVCIVVFNLAAMSVYPLIVEATEALKIMLM